MPILEVKTTGSKVVWQSPDKQRTIYELQLEYEGKPVKANTYSDSIAETGWSGEVETYERPGKGNNPSQTFVRQPPKETGSYPRGNSTGSKGYQPKDEKAIQAMWAIRQAIKYAEVAKVKIEEPINIEAIAQELFTMVDRVKVVPGDTIDTPNEPETAPEPDVVHDPEIAEDIQDIFAGAEKAAVEVVEEDPWLPRT